MGLKRKITIPIVLALGVLLLLVSVCTYRNLDLIDPDALRDSILASDMVRILDDETHEVLFESRDMDEIHWLSKVFVPDRGSPRWVNMAKKRYKLVFYKDSKISADIGMQIKLRFNWVDPAWGFNTDFLLTSESYGEILPWLCEKSGKKLNELFPATDYVKGLRDSPPPTKGELGPALSVKEYEKRRVRELNKQAK